MTTPFQDDLINEIFTDRHDLAFLGALDQQQDRLPQGGAEFFRRRGGDFLDRFQQTLGGQLMGGTLPSLSPQEFFGGLDFQREFFKFSPESRGMSTSRFNPTTRFFF